MFNWWKRKADKSDGHRPLIHEPLILEENTAISYKEWTGSLEKKRLMNQILDAFLVFTRRGETLDQAIDFTDTRMHRGFILHLDKLSFPFSTYRFLLELLKDQLLSDRYFLSLNDVMTRSDRRGLRTVYRYYLKPSMKGHTADLRPQHFGNVKIELHVIDDIPVEFHCLATIYQDSAFEDPRGMKEMMDAMLLS